MPVFESQSCKTCCPLYSLSHLQVSVTGPDSVVTAPKHNGRSASEILQWSWYCQSVFCHRNFPMDLPWLWIDARCSSLAFARI